jgi:hypothetical protein
MAAPSSSFTFGDAANLASAGVSILNAGVSAYLPYAQLAEGIEAAGAQKAAGIYQRGLFEVQAIDTLALANIRADQEEKIATLQAGRRLQQANIEARNYQIQSNRMLKNLRATNAAVRARAAANGVSISSGSAAQLQDVNTQTAMFDVGITDLNSMMARVFGYEDATAMFITGKQQCAVHPLWCRAPSLRAAPGRRVRREVGRDSLPGLRWSIPA